MTARSAPLLTIDRGNSTLDCRLGSDPAARRERLDPADAAAFERFLGDCVPRAAVAVSVVDGALAPVQRALERRGVRLRVAGVDLRCPLAIGYDDPRQLGTDRWLAALAARERHGDALVVDCGTALTFGVVWRDGRYQPGPIGAGLRTMSQALAARAPALPEFDFAVAASFPPRGTVDAVRSGIGLGFADLVESIARRLLLAVGAPDATWVVTGGDADALLARSPRAWRHEPALVHDGLVSLAESS
ncbi:MAG: type III pantothenate kinase [Planctomycetes bacterium]|nr:type III pantothenate kinase [Planctomycetota bacterium]